MQWGKIFKLVITMTQSTNLQQIGGQKLHALPVNY